MRCAIYTRKSSEEVHAEFVGGAVRDPRLDAAARHPHGEAVVVMAAADGFLYKLLIPLLKRRASVGRRIRRRAGLTGRKGTFRPYQPLES